MSQAEITMALASAISKIHENVKIDYIDVIDDDMDEFPAIDKYLREKGMRLPLIVINDKPHPEVSLTFHDLIEAIKKSDENLINFLDKPV